MTTEERKKQLRRQYADMKPDMGIYMLKCNPTGKVYLGADQNLTATMNGILFQLKLGSYITNRNLQNDWKTYGADNFTIEVLEILEYEKEKTIEGEDEIVTPPKTNYSKELEALLGIWQNKFDETELVKKVAKPKASL